MDRGATGEDIPLAAVGAHDGPIGRLPVQAIQRPAGAGVVNRRLVDGDHILGLQCPAGHEHRGAAHDDVRLCAAKWRARGAQEGPVGGLRGEFGELVVGQLPAPLAAAQVLPRGHRHGCAAGDAVHLAVMADEVAVGQRRGADGFGAAGSGIVTGGAVFEVRPTYRRGVNVP